MNAKAIAIGCDHAGFRMRESLLPFLKNAGYTVIDFGTFSEESVDYPDFVHPVARCIESGEASCGILICGSANGVAITANKHKAIRAAVVWQDVLASLARQHNDANVICLPARFISAEEALQFTQTFLNTAFEGGRHQRRVEKISYIG